MSATFSDAVLTVGGLHCAGCIQKIESTLQSEKSIRMARVNFSTQKLHLVWEGPFENLEDYVKRVESLGFQATVHDPLTDDLERKVRQRQMLLSLGVSGFALGNVMLISIGLWITDTETMGFGTRRLMNILSALIAIPAVLYSGQVFFKSALTALKHKTTNMDVPISVALITTTAISLFGTLRGEEHIYFDSALMLMFFLLIGRYLDMRARGQAAQAASGILGNTNDVYKVVHQDIQSPCRVSDLVPDMVIIVEPGRRFPVDGIIVDGEGFVDTSLVTGEGDPLKMTMGEHIYAGMINISSPIKIKVEKPAGESLTEKIKILLERATHNKSKYIRFADRIARTYTPLVHSLALITFLFWFFVKGVEWQTALITAVTVLIITCPCALGLAVPVVHVLAIGRLLKRGIILKTGDALERLSQITYAVFDKTGVLTTGKTTLTGEYNKTKLQIAASLAVNSYHPLSRALSRSYAGPLIKFDCIKEYPGMGIEGVYKNKIYRLGRYNWDVGEKAKDRIQETTETWLMIDGKNPYVFYFSDKLRDQAVETVSFLQKNHIKADMLTGDKRKPAEQIAEQTGITGVYAEQTPVEKHTHIELLKKRGERVLAVGDGLNDAAALALADVSIAPSSAVDLTQNTADIVFMGESLKPVQDVYLTSLKSQSLIRQNFVLAVCYNMIAIPAAMAGLVTPALAALAMSASSLVVIANSFRLNRLKL